MAEWLFTYQSESIDGYYRNLLGGPVTAFARATDGLSSGVTLAGRYKLTVVSGDGPARTALPAFYRESAYGKCVAVSGKLWCFGGTNDTGRYGSVRVYDPSADVRWQARAPMPRQLSGFSVCHHDGYFYLFGGYDGTTYYADVWRYEIATDSWVDLGTPDTTTRAGHVAVVCLGWMFICGGDNAAHDCSETVGIFNLTTQAWTAGAADTGHGQTTPQGALHGHLLYIVGEESGAPVTRVYNCATDAWSAGTADTASSVRDNALCFVYDNRLWLFGGGTYGESGEHNVRVYDFIADTWSGIWTAEYVKGFAGDVISGTLYLLGGDDHTDGYLDTFTSWELPPRGALRCVDIEAWGLDEANSPVIGSGLSADFNAGSTNTNLFPGYTLELSPTATVGMTALIGVGCVNTATLPSQSVLNQGQLLSGLGAKSSVALTITSDAGETLTLCELLATNGVSIESTDSPFASFVQRGKLNPTPDTDDTGAEITFSVITTEEEEEIYTLTLTANDAPSPFAVTATPDEDDPAYYASDDDATTAWITTSSITIGTPAVWELSLGTERQTCNKLTITCTDTAGTQPLWVSVEAYCDDGATEWWQTVADGEYCTPDVNDQIVVTWEHPDTDWTVGGYRVTVWQTDSDTTLEIAEFTFSYVYPSNTYQVLVDGVAADIYDVSTGAVVSGVARDGTVYEFGDDSEYRGCQFVLSDTFDGTQTAQIYVSDAGNYAELSLDNTAFVRGPDGVELTGSGQADGTVTDSQSITAYFRLRSEGNTTSAVDRWPWSLRAVGYDATGDEHTQELMGSLTVQATSSPVHAVGGSLIIRANVITGVYPRPRYAEDEENPGTYIRDDEGGYVQALTDPASYVLVGDDPQGGDYKSILEYLSENGVTIL